jgi:hypothetical protein
VAVSEYRKVRKEGGSNTVTMGKSIPEDWRLVRLEEVDKGETEEGREYVTIRFERVE